MWMKVQESETGFRSGRMNGYERGEKELRLDRVLGIGGGRDKRKEQLQFLVYGVKLMELQET